MIEKFQNTVKKNLVYNQLLLSVLIISYCCIYGITAHMVLNGIQLMFFMCSFIYALTIFYVRDPVLKKDKAKKGIIYNQVFGTILVVSYIVLFGASSITLMKGFQLLFFMSSYIFAMSVFYLRDPERLKKQEDTSASTTYSPFVERTPCFINNKDLSWFVREVNGSLSTVVGFAELMLSREYNNHEKEYMLRNIHEHALKISGSLSRVSSLISDSPVKPKEIHEVANLVDDKNFK